MSAFLDLPDAETLRDRWKWFVTFGVILAVIGLVALWNVVDATLVTTILIGWLLVLGAIAQIAGAIAGGGTTAWRLLSGIIGLLYGLAGLNIITDPLRGAVVLTTVIAIVLIAEGVLRLYDAFSGGTAQRGLAAGIGVIDILLGIWLFVGIPVSGLAIGFFVGLQLLMAGIAWVMIGLMARSAVAPAGPAAAA